MNSDEIFTFLYNNIDIRMYMPYKNDYIMNFIKRYHKFWEKGQLEFVSKFITSNSTVLDCGAYIGNHTIYFSKILNCKKVIAIEPQRNIYQILCENIKINNINNARCINCGLYYDRNYRLFIKEQQSTNYGATRYDACREGGSVDCLTLDDFNDIDFLKIDCEGMAYEILVGGTIFFNKNKPVIWLEMNPEYKDELYHEFVQPLNFLMDLGYKLGYKLSAYDYIYIKD